ncbi:hypothetical protein DXG01_017137 [Tephrocybe rancida]|nr:hypothetical protein DXG01_017137 [Tephrocybe rancida]
MSAHDNSSDIDGDSQASQLLNRMLNPEGSGWKKSDPRLPSQENDSISTKDSITDSSPSRNSNSWPNLDFHGLAQTQTQNFDEDVDANEGSQKENIKTTREGFLASMQTAPHVDPTPARGTKSKLVPAKAVSFQSPRKKPLPPQTIDRPGQRQPTRSTTLPGTREARVKRIASPISSQDSFGVLEQDPGQLFLATAKQFNVPLSELPRVVLPTAAASSSRHNPDSMFLSNHPLRRYQRSPSPSEGTVLVESTPSASGGSQSQPSQYQDTQIVEAPSALPDHDDMDDNSQHPIEDCLSDAPSNFYAENNDDSFPSTALEATQPSTQVDDENAMDIDQVHPFDAPVPDSTGYSGTAESTAATNPRSLLFMVDPAKRHRYQHLLQRQHQPEAAPASPLNETRTTHRQSSMSNTRSSNNAPPSPGSSPSIQPSEPLVETQLSFEAEVPKPVQRHFPVRPMLPDKLPVASTRSGWSRQETKDIGMGVVPDSDPHGDEAKENPPRNPIQPPFEVGFRPKSAVESNAHNQGSHAEVARALFPGDDEEEEDIPLADIGRYKTDRTIPMDLKGKGRAFDKDHIDHLTTSSGFRQQGDKPFSRRQQAVKEAQVPLVDQSAPISNIRTTGASTSLPASRPSDTVHSWQNGVVPSSIPGEDAGQTNATNAAPPKKGKGKAATSQACAKPKPKAAAPVKRARKRANSTAKESSLSASDDELSFKPASDEDTGSEPADDAHMDPDFAGPSSRKRKRSAPAAQAGKTKLKPAKKVKKVASSTPSTRQTKRLRSVKSVASTSRTSDATRVFALWKSDGCYYSGTIYTDCGDGVYEVAFDDGSNACVSIDQMRLLDLRVNDDVIIPRKMRSFKVAAIDKLDTSQVVDVHVDDNIQEIPLARVKIAAKTIGVAWQDRTLTHHTISPIIGPDPVKASPAPSALSSTNVPLRRPGRGHLFEKTAFVVSVSSNDGNWEKQRENLMSAIRNNGGVIVNDWSEVINMEGTYSEHNNRWVIEKREAKWAGTNGIERIFLVADHPSLKPKFLVALALGIPCLKVGWLHDTVSTGEEKDWTAYMLGQGYSEVLSTQVSQQVDMNWGYSVHHLNDIMDNKVPCKLLSGKSILCVGDMVPKMKGKKGEEKAHEAHNAVTRIILAMGADRVEAVSDAAYSSAPLHEFDLVVVKKAEHYSPNMGMVEGKTVYWNWVKDCLIASRLLPQSRWETESQDA